MLVTDEEGLPLVISLAKAQRNQARQLETMLEQGLMLCWRGWLRKRLECLGPTEDRTPRPYEDDCNARGALFISPNATNGNDAGHRRKSVTGNGISNAIPSSWGILFPGSVLQAANNALSRILHFGLPANLFEQPLDKRRNRVLGYLRPARGYQGTLSQGFFERIEMVRFA